MNNSGKMCIILRILSGIFFIVIGICVLVILTETSYTVIKETRTVAFVFSVLLIFISLITLFVIIIDKNVSFKDMGDLFLYGIIPIIALNGFGIIDKKDQLLAIFGGAFLVLGVTDFITIIYKWIKKS